MRAVTIAEPVTIVNDWEYATPYRLTTWGKIDRAADMIFLFIGKMMIVCVGPSMVALPFYWVFGIDTVFW